MAAASSGVAPDRGGGGEDLCGALHRAFLVEVRCHQPLVQVERVAGGGEDGAAVDDAERAVHAEAKPFEHGGEVPGIDQLAVDRGLAAHRVEPGAVQEGRPQRVTGERLVEPGERRGGLRQGAGQRRIQVFFCPRRPQQCVEHRSPRAPPRAAWHRPVRRSAPRDPRRINDLRVRLRKPGDSVQWPVLCVPPPCPPLLCPISPLVGHGNSGHPGAANTRQERQTHDRPGQRPDRPRRAAPRWRTHRPTPRPAAGRVPPPLGAPPIQVRRWFDRAVATPLPAFDGTLATARATADAFARLAKAANTRRAYRAGVRRLVRLVRPPRAALPARVRRRRRGVPRRRAPARPGGQHHRSAPRRDPVFALSRRLPGADRRGGGRRDARRYPP